MTRKTVENSVENVEKAFVMGLILEGGSGKDLLFLGLYYLLIYLIFLS